MSAAEAASVLQSGARTETAVGDYEFFVYRRYMWVVQRSLGKAQFFHIPETAHEQSPIVKSRVYEVDREAFPPELTEYIISDRNLTNYLWITNPVTGRAQFIRARRDGGFDVSPLVDASSEL